MQHFNAHTIVRHAAAALTLLALSFAFLISSLSVAHAAPSPTGPGTGSINTPATSPTGPGTGSIDYPSQNTGQTIANPLKYNSLNDLLSAVLAAAIKIGSIILTLAIVWVGFQFVAARGNEEKIRSARTALMWTIIGGLILLGATAIQAVITSTVGSLTT